MRRRSGFSLVELLVVIAIVVLLLGILVPTFGRVKELARLAVCAQNQSAIHRSIGSYAAENQTRLPPFSMSDPTKPDILLSGHWGGTRNSSDPAGFFRRGIESLNLWTLVDSMQLPAAALICPSAELSLRERQCSFFGYSDQFSTYCLRFPASEDLFNTSPKLAYWGGGHLLNIYTVAPGAWAFPTGRTKSIVPQVFMHKQYRLLNGGIYDVGQDTLLVDGFWYQNYRKDATGSEPFSVRRAASHAERYNVLRGDGSVRTVIDDGVVAASAVAASETPTGQPPYLDQAERFWLFFNEAK